MPTEVLVMCKGCGRPQPAAQGHCAACGALLPEAPLPAPLAPAPPFLDVDLGGGRTLRGLEGRVTFRAGPSSAPVVVELGNLRDVRLRQRPLYEALVVGAVLAAVLAAVPAPRLLALAVLGVALALTAAWRRCSLEVHPAGGPPGWWPLGTVRQGSTRQRLLFEAFIRLTEALRARERGAGTPGA